MIPNEDHPDPADRAELDATAYALGDLSAHDAETVAARLSADAQAKRVCAETKVIAEELRDVYAASPLPSASAELRASLDNHFTNAHSEERIVTKAPDVIPPARRRFTPLEILLSIAVLCFAALFVLMNVRQNSLTAHTDTSQSVTGLDSSHPTGSTSESTILLSDGSESMPGADELDQRRDPAGSLYVEKNGPSHSSPSTPLGLKYQLGRGEAPSTSDYTYDSYDGATPTVDAKPANKPVWQTEYYRGGRSAQHFPVEMTTPEQLAAMQRTYNDEKDEIELSVPARRRPTSRVTADLRPSESSPDDLYSEFEGGTTVQLPSLDIGTRNVLRLEKLKQEIALARGEIKLAQSDRDEKLQRLVELTDKLHREEDLRRRIAEQKSAGDQHARIYENEFKSVEQDPLSTFSIDVDTASYSKMRQHILQHGQLPPPDAIRIEELINYFPYDYNEPMDEHPFAAHMEVAQCPWKAEHRLARIAIKGKDMKPDERPASNLVFLVDVSGSMNEANKLPLVVRGLEMLTRELGKNDRVAIVVYAGAAGLVLPSTSGEEKETILAALGKLEAGGSTAGAEGINLAYKTAEEHFIHAGVNRVILCTDGDFNVGTSDTGSLVRLAEEQAKKNIFLSILGFGIGNLNDEMLEQVSGKANGMYAFIDTENEARKVLVEQMSGTLVTIAKDVKIQIEFNPAKVAAYRLIGYENRILAAEDFNNDKKDAGEIGAGHTVTALYEIVPVIATEKPEIPVVDELKYQRPSELTDAAESDELLTLKLRYKSPEGEKSTLLSEPVDDSTEAFGKVSDDFKFAAAVASFGMLLRGSEYSGDATLDAVLEIATDGAKHDEWGYRKEFLEIVKRAKELKQ